MRAADKSTPWLVSIMAVLLAVPLIALSPAWAQTAEEVATAEVLVDSVAPAIPKAKSSLRISGRIANTSSIPLTSASIRVNLSPTPLISRGEVPEVLSGESQRLGQPIIGFESITVENLEPGQQASFTARVKLADLGLPAMAAVYALFVEVALQDSVIGRAGVTLPWFSKNAEYAPSKVALLWPITQEPGIAADELVLNAELPREYAAQGRLGQLLTVGAQSPVSWLVDAATVTTAIELSDGYRVQTNSGPEPGDRPESAEQFLVDLESTLADQRPSLPGYAMADADALNRADLTAFVVRSATIPTLVADRALKSSDSELLFAPPGGWTDSDTLKELVDAGVRAALLQETSFPTEEFLNYTPTGATTIEVGDDQISVYLADSQLAEALGQDLATTPKRSLAQQYVLADLAMITLERPNEVRRVVAQPPAIWNPPASWASELLRNIEQAPWIDPIALDDVLKGPLVTRQMAPYGRQQRKQELPTSYTARIKAQEAALDSLSRIVNDPNGFGETFTLALQRASSGLWRQNPAARTELMDTISAQLVAERDKVAVVSAGSVTLAGDNGTLPLTVANDLDRDVTVGLELATGNQVRLTYKPPDPVTVKAGQKAGLEVPIQVAGSQPLEVTVVLTDAQGGFFSDSATLQLQSTASTRIAAIVVGIGGVTLVLLVGFRLWRRRRG